MHEFYKVTWFSNKQNETYLNKAKADKKEYTTY